MYISKGLFCYFRFYWRQYYVLGRLLLLSNRCYIREKSYKKICISRWPLAHWLLHWNVFCWNHQRGFGIHVQLCPWHSHKVIFVILIKSKQYPRVIIYMFNHILFVQNVNAIFTHQLQPCPYRGKKAIVFVILTKSRQNFMKTALSLRPDSSENIPILFQGADLYFSNQNHLRNPKMGSKQSVVVPPY